jgi:hemerythrin-like domain-containing protein
MDLTAEGQTQRAFATSLLSQHHRSLDERLDKLMRRAREEDPAALRAEWAVFERELSRHMEQEEAEILPIFAKHDPAEAHALLSEHCAIRNALLDLGLNLDLHCLRAEAVDDFVQRLRAHAKREDAALYPWAQSHLPVGRWQSITRGLKGAAATGRRLMHLTDRIM